MATWLQDLRYGLRLLRKDRSFAVTALLTLALAVGANTAIFAIVQSVLLRPLPIEAADRLVLLYNSYPKAGAPRVGAGVPDWLDRQREMPALAEVALFRTEGRTWGSERGAERLTGLRATPSFFRIVRLQPVHGRIFTDEEGEPGTDDRVILSYGFWQRGFGGDPDVVNTTVRLSGRTMTVVGVAPEGFTFLEDTLDFFLPAAFSPREKSDDARHSNNWQMIGRLADGATVEQVRQQVDALNARNDERFPHFRQPLADAGFHTIVIGLRDDLVRDVEAVLYLLWGGVLFVLLIAAVNLANLVLVRSSARAHELATRHAIGADLGRLARQLLTETMLLAVTGGALGILFGWWVLRWVVSLDLDGLPRAGEIGLDGPSVMVSLALSVLVGLLIGLMPATRLGRMNLNVELREEGRSGTGGRRGHRTRRVLATAQVAVAFVLLIGAGLLLASFRAVLRIDPGFDPDRVHTASFSLPSASYADDTAVRLFEQRALESLRAIPTVTAAGLTSSIPFGGDVSNSVILAEGYQMQPGESLISPSRIIVSQGYFEAMGIALIDGRLFTEADTADAPAIVVIDERLARKFWPGRSPIGRRLYLPDDINDLTKITANTRFFTVGGVVAETQFYGPRADYTPVGTYYFPNQQVPGRTMTFAVKAVRDDPALANAMRRAIAAIDPELPLYRVQMMQDYIDQSRTSRRVPVYVALAFGLVGLFLSAVGIYGVLAYGVAERRRELGVRMALGGSAGQLFGLVLRDGALITGVGLVLGLAGAWGLGGVMQGLLYEVAPTDPAVLAVVAAVLAIVALAASVIPSWRAARINPVIVLNE